VILRYIFSSCVKSQRSDSWRVLRKFLLFLGLVIHHNHPFHFFFLQFINSPSNLACTPHVISVPDVYSHSSFKIIKSKIVKKVLFVLLIGFELLDPFLKYLNFFGFIFFYIVHDQIIEQNIVGKALVADTGATLWALVNKQHVLSETQLTKSVLAGSGHRMRNKILTNFTEYGDPVYITLLILKLFIFLFVFLFLLIFDRTNFLFIVTLNRFFVVLNLLLLRILDFLNLDSSINSLFVWMTHVFDFKINDFINLVI